MHLSEDQLERLIIGSCSSVWAVLSASHLVDLDLACRTLPSEQPFVGNSNMYQMLNRQINIHGALNGPCDHIHSCCWLMWTACGTRRDRRQYIRLDVLDAHRSAPLSTLGQVNTRTSVSVQFDPTAGQDALRWSHVESFTVPSTDICWPSAWSFKVGSHQLADVGTVVVSSFKSGTSSSRLDRVEWRDRKPDVLMYIPTRH